MRIALLLALTLSTGTSAAFAASQPDTIPDLNTLAAMEQKAEHAALRDQSFLYAELIHGMSLVATTQLAAGDAEHAGMSLEAMQRYSGLVESGLARDTKKLRDAEILMRQAAFHMKQTLDASAAEDRPAVEQALKQLNQTEAKVLLAVMAH